MNPGWDGSWEETLNDFGDGEGGYTQTARHTHSGHGHNKIQKWTMYCTLKNLKSKYALPTHTNHSTLLYNLIRLICSRNNIQDDFEMGVMHSQSHMDMGQGHLKVQKWAVYI